METLQPKNTEPPKVEENNKIWETIVKMIAIIGPSEIRTINKEKVEKK